MTNRRRPAWQITPLIEDGGLFKREVRDVAVELVPVFWRNNRNDLLVTGLVPPGTEIEVVFAGRRTREAVSLVDRMKHLRRQGLRCADSGHEALNAVRQLRLAVQIRGTWRLRFERDDSGWEAKKYQLIAAQWAFHDLDGFRVVAGCRRPNRNRRSGCRSAPAPSGPGLPPAAAGPPPRATASERRAAGLRLRRRGGTGLGHGRGDATGTGRGQPSFWISTLCG